MARTLSTMLPLGTRAPEFALPDINGHTVRLADLSQAQAMLVIFMCNHCPFVKHIIDPLKALIEEYQARGVAVVGINANDVHAYPEDSVDNMKAVARKKGFSFGYLYDETQAVARAYKASCTPDFFVFDRSRRLVYRGQMDDSRPGNGVPVTGRDLRDALDAVLAGRAVKGDQKPSMGCNIKWKPGNEPDY